MKEEAPSELLGHFLKEISRMETAYKLAYDAVSGEDKLLQDFLHELEFAPDSAARNRTAGKLQRSRRSRRENKDRVLLYKEIIEFFGNERNRAVLNQLRQLLGRQRKQEEYLFGERIYKKKAGGAG